jgi:hypothetical protein
MTGYDFDLFLSYRRAGSVTSWMRNHFAPVLVECLADELPREPRVFLDLTIETGAYWPAELERALRRTRLLIPVWTPQYFTSPWCRAEWETMLAREKALGLSTVERPHGLVYPVVFADWQNFPDRARETQARDLKQWNVPMPQFRNTSAYVDFYREMRSIAAEIADAVGRVPEWQDDWPVVRPEHNLRATAKPEAF